MTGQKFKKLISVILLVVFMVNMIPQKTSANAALKIVAGSQAEKILIGIGEKAGVKFANKTARQKAIDRWNWEWKQNIEAQTTPIETTTRYADFIQEITTAKPEPFAGKPGWSKVILSSAAFLTGADLVYEGYAAFKNAYESQQYLDTLSENVKQGNTYKDGLGIKFNVFAGSGAYKQWQLTNFNGFSITPYQFQVDVGKEVNYFTVDLQGTTAYYITGYFGGTKDGVFRSTTLGKSVGISALTSTVMTETFQPVVDDVPNVSVPTGMGTVALPGIQSIPEVPDMPQTIEILIPDGPLADVDPVTEVVNEPWVPDPVSKPVPDIVPEVGENPNSDIQLDPNGNPIPVTPTLPPAETPPEGQPPNACDRPWDFKNFKTLGDNLSTAFPFSIPWDINRALHAAFDNMSSEKPIWKLKIYGETIKITIPDFFDDWRAFLHTSIIVLFDVGLVYAIRKWFGGAS